LNYQYSPLRYPGGKAKIAPYLEHLIKLNSLTNCKYFEPFAGGAGAALELLLCEHVDSIYINDADKSIYSFWEAILRNSEKFIRKLDNTDINIEEWQKQKKIMRKKNASTFDIGFATFFVNRCNVSGILSGGPIGGKNQTGKWKIDARMNKATLIKKIEKIALYSDRVFVSNEDWLKFLDKKISNLNSKNYFIFLDPPYYKKGKDLYMNHFIHEDHEALEYYLRGKKNWVLTYDYAPEIIEIYKKYRKSEYVLNYSANNFRKEKEIMIFSPNLK